MCCRAGSPDSSNGVHLWQLAQDSIPPNATQNVHAFSTTTLNDIMKSFSDVSVIRVAGGYLLMVRVPLLSVLCCPSIAPQALLTHCALPAGLRLCHHAEVGLLQVPRSCGPGWGPACGSLCRLWPGALLAAGHLLQCSHHPGMYWGKSWVL